MAMLAAALPAVGSAGSALSAVGTLVSVIGLVGQAGAQRAAGKQAQAIANAQALAMEQKAGQERAAGQRRLIDARREGRIVSSRAQALAAASGAGALDPSIVGILGDLETETDIRALTAFYEGEETATGLEHQADITRAGGAGEALAARNRSGATLARAGGTLLQGGATLYDRYASGSRAPVRSRSYSLPGHRGGAFY